MVRDVAKTAHSTNLVSSLEALTREIPSNYDASKPEAAEASLVVRR